MKLRLIETSLPTVKNNVNAFHGNETGLSLRAGGRGFSPDTKRVAPGFFYWKIEEKKPKEIPSHLIPCLLVVFTRQLEILVTTLNERTYAIQTRHNSSRSRTQNISLCFLISISAVILKLMLKITSISPRDLGEYLRRRRRSAFIYHTFIHTHNLLHYSGFPIEGGTRRLIAAYFEIYSRLLCV